MVAEQRNLTPGEIDALLLSMAQRLAMNGVISEVGLQYAENLMRIRESLAASTVAGGTHAGPPEPGARRG
jgi:hypothetical protein